MVYLCICEKCTKVTEIDTTKVEIDICKGTFVTSFGYIITICKHYGCNQSFTKWRGLDGKLKFKL